MNENEMLSQWGTIAVALKDVCVLYTLGRHDELVHRDGVFILRYYGNKTAQVSGALDSVDGLTIIKHVQSSRNEVHMSFNS